MEAKSVRRLFVKFVVASLFLAGIAHAVDVKLTQIEKSAFPKITLFISALDDSNRPVTNLTQSDFQITEDGTRVAITHFFGPETPRPIHVALILDRSGSMAQQEKLDAAKMAAKTFISLMRHDDQTAVIVFDHSVNRLLQLTSDKGLLSRTIDPIATGGQTAFFDAVYQGLETIKGIRGRKVVIALTDGMDNRSSRSLDEITRFSNQYSTPVYTIGLGARSTATAAEAGIYEPVLSELANRTGGQYFYAPSGSELVNLYRSLSLQLQSGYEISYITPKLMQDGTSRKAVSTVRFQGSVGRGMNSYYVPGVLVPSSDLTLFLFLLAPLVLLLFVPHTLKRIKPAFFQNVVAGLNQAVKPLRRSGWRTISGLFLSLRRRWLDQRRS